MTDIVNDLLLLLGRPALGFAPTITAAFLLAFPPWHQLVVSGGLTELAQRIYRAILIAMLCVDSAAASSAMWLAVTAVHFIWIWKSYPVADNHRYLEGYWCGAIGVSLLVPGPSGDVVLVNAARMLIGACFALSVLWKVTSKSYRSGAFFAKCLVSDNRFLFVAVVFGDFTSEAQRQHILAQRLVLGGRVPSDHAVVPRRLRLLAHVFTWWTIGIESLVALSMLWPTFGDGGSVYLEMASLTTFAVTTYLTVPVEAFGNVLLLMCAAIAPSVSVRLTVVVIAMVLTVVTFIPTILRERATRAAARRLAKLTRSGTIDGC